MHGQGEQLGKVFVVVVFVFMSEAAERPGAFKTGTCPLDLAGASCHLKEQEGIG